MLLSMPIGAPAGYVCVQFVDSTIQGLQSWGAEAADLLQSLRDRAYFTQRNKVRCGVDYSLHYRIDPCMG
jgi:hypothetical protein